MGNCSDPELYVSLFSGHHKPFMLRNDCTDMYIFSEKQLKTWSIQSDQFNKNTISVVMCTKKQLKPETQLSHCTCERAIRKNFFTPHDRILQESKHKAIPENREFKK